MKYGYTAAEKIVLWLDGFGELTYRQKQKILGFFPDPLEVVKGFLRHAEELCGILSEKQYDEMRKTLDSPDPIAPALNALKERGMFFVTLYSEDYPAALAETPAPPFVLYCKGNRGLLNTKCFAVVGSRGILPWAKSLGEEISSVLTEHFTIVTGLADGGDRAAIDGVLSGENEEINLISVIAHGIDHVYPSVHAPLLREICRRGLVVSEYPPQIAPQKYYFPVRNRLIAGMSVGVLVLSAGARSGTSITAGYAADYGRDVFAIPYNPNIPSGEGCNKLLKTGAIVATEAEDILAVYGIEQAKREPDVPPSLEGEEKEIYDFISGAGGAHVEEIASACGKAAYELGGTLSALEVKGLIVRMGGNRFEAVRTDGRLNRASGAVKKDKEST